MLLFLQQTYSKTVVLPKIDAIQFKLGQEKPTEIERKNQRGTFNYGQREKEEAETLSIEKPEFSNDGIYICSLG